MLMLTEQNPPLWSKTMFVFLLSFQRPDSYWMAFLFSLLVKDKLKISGLKTNENPEPASDICTLTHCLLTHTWFADLRSSLTLTNTHTLTYTHPTHANCSVWSLISQSVRFSVTKQHFILQSSSNCQRVSTYWHLFTEPKLYKLGRQKLPPIPDTDDPKCSESVPD